MQVGVPIREDLVEQPFTITYYTLRRLVSLFFVGIGMFEMLFEVPFQQLFFFFGERIMNCDGIFSGIIEYYLCIPAIISARFLNSDS